MNNKVNISISDSIYYQNKNQTNKSYFISFKYDPLLVETMRQLPNRKWLIDKKIWEVPYNEENTKLLKWLMNYTEAEVKEPLPLQKVDYTNLKKIDITANDVRVTANLYEHQIDVLRYGIIKNSFLLGDEMGLGKTLSIINYGLYRKYNYHYKHCLVVAGINGLKYNWYYEIKRYVTTDTGYILGAREDKKGNLKTSGTKTILADLDNIDNINDYFLITNIESIRNDKILVRIIELIKSGEINMIVLDEAQVIKSNNSKQTKNFLLLKPQTKILATGTPIMNNPLDLWPMLKWLGQEDHNFYQFKNFHCVMGGFKNYQIIDYKHLDELQKKVNNIMLRRLRKDVLDLPDKIYTTEFLEMSNSQRKIYEDIKQNIVEWLKAETSKNLNSILVKLIRLRQATADTSIVSEIQEAVKFDRLKDIAEELYKNNKKFIVYSNWTTVINKAYSLLKPYNPSLITGEVDEVSRELEIAMFRDGDNFCILGTVGALGTGYTLTEAEVIIFLDSPWNNAKKEQAIDRAYRIGQKNNLTVITLVCKDTIDEKIEELIYSKKLTSDCIIDNKININDAEAVANYLLS